MKTLLLLRHAQALPAESGGDIERKLSPKGLSDALALGQSLSLKNLQPEQIYCSTAKRTRQTCEKLLEGLDARVHTEFSKIIYTANVGDLFHLIQNTDDTIETLMIVGHNPTIYELAVKLSSQGAETVMNHLSLGYPPASLSVIQANAPSWAEIDPAGCTIKELLDPLDYNAPSTPARWT